MFSVARWLVGGGLLTVWGVSVVFLVVLVGGGRVGVAGYAVWVCAAIAGMSVFAWCAGRVRRAVAVRVGPAPSVSAGELRLALSRGELQLHYQPQVTVGGDVVAMEALLRWPGPRRPEVGAEEILRAADACGMGGRVTAFVLESAVAQAAVWHRQGWAVQIAVNFAAADVLRPHFAAGVLRCLRRHRLAPEAFKVEITEHGELRDGRRAAGALAVLRSHGVTVSLDDFGTGHCSLSRLRMLPVDELKIDRSFVSGMITDERDAAIVRYSLGLARCLQLTVVAEGVETQQELDRLVAYGGCLVQGWLVCRPLHGAAATQWLKDHASCLR